MSKSKLLEIVETLKKGERDDLLIFAEMASNKLSEREREILAYIFGKINARHNINEEIIIQKYLHKNEIDNWNRMKNQLLNMIVKFLLLQDIDGNSSRGNYLRCLYFSRQNLSKNYNASIKRGLSLNTKKGYINEQSLLFKYQLHELKVNENKTVRRQDGNFDLMEEALDIFYLENKLRCLCERRNRKNIINTADLNSIFIHNVDTTINSIDAPGVNIYYNIFKMLSEENNDEYFQKVDKLVWENISYFDPEYSKAIITYLMNFCVYKVNKGLITYAPEYIKYIDVLYDKKHPFKESTMNHSRYKNAIYLALLAKDVNLANKILNKYRAYLAPNLEVYIYNFNKAQIAFYEKEYKSALDCLNLFIPFDMYYNIACKKLLLKIHFQLISIGKYEIEKIIVSIASMKKFIQIQKNLTPDKKKQVNLFLGALSTVVNAKRNLKLEKLKGKINPMDYHWFEKISQKNSIV